MTDDRLSHAIGRLERALAHLEGRLPLARVPATTGEDAQAIQQRYDRLEERHHALRTRTSAAVERLGRLLDPAQED